MPVVPGVPLGGRGLHNRVDSTPGLVIYLYAYS